MDPQFDYKEPTSLPCFSFYIPVESILIRLLSHALKRRKKKKEI